MSVSLTGVAGFISFNTCGCILTESSDIIVIEIDHLNDYYAKVLKWKNNDSGLLIHPYKVYNIGIGRL